jgi:alpha-ketoglutarate-dependent 2,4-dichlorophenoxyacetate dioxygenase
MSLQLNPLHPVFAAEAYGVDIRQPLPPQVVRQIDDAMDKYAVLVFRNQPLDQDQQIAFTRQFGKLDAGLRKARAGQHRFKYDELIDISNVDAQGRIDRANLAKIGSNVANALWHSDSSFQKPAAKYSMLHAVHVPPRGGETEFCDLRAAYDALPQDLKEEIAGLKSEHFAFHSRLAMGDNTYTPEQMAKFPPVQWPLVRVHSGSGRKVLWVGVHATHILGRTVPEGRLLLLDLLEHATQRQFVYTHTWQVGDLVIWDNRATLHRGRRWDMSQRRELRRSTIDDEQSLLEAAA